jgi:hypothetical protein
MCDTGLQNISGRVFLGVLRFPLININSAERHLCLYAHVVLTRTNGRNLGTLCKQNGGVSGRKLF